MTRTTASATSAITSPLRSRARAAPAVDRCPASFSEMVTTLLAQVQQRRHAEEHAGDERDEQR